MRKSRTLARAALAAGTVLVLAACGGSPTSPSAGSGDSEDSGPTKAEELYEEVGGLSGQERRDRLVELAAEEDGLNLYTSMNADILDAVSEAFSDEFDIDVSVYRAGSETVLQRILQEQDAGFPGNDVVETNGSELGALQTGGRHGHVRRAGADRPGARGRAVRGLDLDPVQHLRAELEHRPVIRRPGPDLVGGPRRPQVRRPAGPRAR